MGPRGVQVRLGYETTRVTDGFVVFIAVSSGRIPPWPDVKRSHLRAI